MVDRNKIQRMGAVARSLEVPERFLVWEEFWEPWKCMLHDVNHCPDCIEDYYEHLQVYLKHAYTNDAQKLFDKNSWLDNPKFFAHGIPFEARYGCRMNGNMKMRIKRDKWEFWVDTNDGPDPDVVKRVSKRIKGAIEDEWKRTFDR